MEQGVRCPFCGGVNAVGLSHCSLCGQSLHSPGYPTPAVKRRSRTTPVVLSATALVLAITLVLGLWKPAFLWNLKGQLMRQTGSGQAIGSDDLDLETALSEKPQYSPTKIPVSGIPAFSVSPMEGVTISAPDNALDKERICQTTPLSESQMGELFAGSLHGQYLPVFAFDFDAGLDEGERLPGELQVDIDLGRFDIEDGLLPYLSALRIAHDGSVIELPLQVSDSKISYKTRQNSITAIVIGLSIGIPVMAYIERGHDGLASLYPNETFFEAKYAELKSTKAKYNVTYPKCMARTDSAQLHEIENRYLALRKKYNLDVSMSLADAAMNRAEALGQNPEYAGTDIYGAAYRLMQKFLNDPEHLSIKSTFNDPQWQQVNLWPESVSNVCNRLARADDYLFTQRDFRAPTHVVDIVVIDRWNHGSETLGITRNLYSASPYILINASNSKVLDLQDLLITVTHELFHVVQSGYVYFDSDYYNPFWEASAVLLEKEAFNYYMANQLMSAGDASLLTLSNKLELFDKPLMMPSLWEGVANPNTYMMEQGYAAHQFLEFLKDRYNLGDDFLPGLMSRFAATISTLDMDVHTALMNHTSSNKDVYCNDFRLFCVKNYGALFGRSVYMDPMPEVKTLSKDESKLELFIPYQSFSTRVRDVKVDSTDEKGQQREYKILAVGDPPGYVTPVLRFYQEDSFVAHLSGKDMAMLPESVSKTFHIHEIENYFKTPAGVTPGQGYKYQLYLMLPPAAPDVKFEDDMLVVTPQGFGVVDALREGYDVVVMNPRGEEFYFPQKPYQEVAEIPLRDLEGDRDLEKNDDAKYSVFIVDKVKFPDGSLQYGPDGEKNEMDDELRFEDILGKWDMTQVVSGFSSDLMDELLSQMEGVPAMEGYLDFYGQYMGDVDGTYQGTMSITEYSAGSQIADVLFIQQGNTEDGAVYYRGAWEQIDSNRGSLYLEPAGSVLGDSWLLTFTKQSGQVTCEGTSAFDNYIASYGFTMTAIKQS